MSAKLIGIVILMLIGSPLMADEDQGKILVWMCITPCKGDPNDELVKYKCYTREALEPIWRRETTANQSSMWFGEVRIRCTIHSDGSLSNPTIVVGESCGLLKSVSMQTLLASVPFKPFSDTLIKETGSSYTDEFSFTVTNRRRAAPTSEDRAYGGEKLPSSSSGMD